MIKYDNLNDGIMNKYSILLFVIWGKTKSKVDLTTLFLQSYSKLERREKCNDLNKNWKKHLERLLNKVHDDAIK